MSNFRFRSPARSDTGQVFFPRSRHGALYPGIVAVVAALLALALLVRAVVTGISLAGFGMLAIALVLLAVAALAGYWAWACLTLVYELDRGVLRIRWGLLCHEVPVALLERAVRGRASAVIRIHGLDWPGCHIGHADLPRLGRVRFISLHRSPAEILFLAGPSAAYAIAVAERDGFLRALQSQIDAPAAIDAPRVEMHPLLRALAWQDRAGQSALAAAAALALLATAIVFGRYAGLADQVVLNFPEEGRVGGRTALLGIPLLAWLLLAGNGAAGIRLAATRRTAAFTLLYGLTFLEGLLVIAAVTAV